MQPSWFLICMVSLTSAVEYTSVPFYAMLHILLIYPLPFALRLFLSSWKHIQGNIATEVHIKLQTQALLLFNNRKLTLSLAQHLLPSFLFQDEHRISTEKTCRERKASYFLRTMGFAENNHFLGKPKLEKQMGMTFQN